MKTTQEISVKENQKSDASQQETLAIVKGLSEGEDNSHKSKDKNKIIFRKNSPKKESLSGTGYECDNDDEYDDWFQNA
jgi:hypothetical protein